MSTNNSNNINNVLLPGIASSTNLNEKVASNNINFTSGRSKTLSYTDIIQKITSELKAKFKINEEAKIVKDFESFYSNLMEKLALLKLQHDPPNKNQNITSNENPIVYVINNFFL